MENAVTTIFNTYQFWAADSLLGAFALTRFAPDFSVRQSLLQTAALLFGVQWLLYGIYAVFIYPRFLSPMRNLPTVTKNNSWLFGQWLVLLRNPSGIPMRSYINDVPNDGLIRYFHLFNRERLMITKPKALAEVLSTKSYDFTKPDFIRTNIGRILGIGILFAEGDDHKMQRKNLAPAFTFRHIKELYPIFWRKAREMVTTIEKDELAETMSTGPVDMAEWASRATLDIIGVAGLGQDFNSLADPNTELNAVYRALFVPTRTAQILAILQFFIPVWLIQALPVKRNSDVTAAANLARETSRQLVRSKRALLDKGEKASPDIISTALESGAFSEDSLVDNMMTFLAAGHETTATALSWAMYMLCKHPHVQKRLREEVRSHISTLDDEVNSNTIDNMPYLHAFCQEILRFYAPVPVTLRNTAVDTTIQGQFVPKHTKIIISPWAINFSKELWGEDAEEFNPDRWMAAGQANSGGAQSNYAFMTYLHGPRSCIGSRFATAELECLVAATVGRFEAELADPNEAVTVRGGITARPSKGMKVQLRTVDGW